LSSSPYSPLLLVSQLLLDRSIQSNASAIN
jgi:hypothetical protein